MSDSFWSLERSKCSRCRACSGTCPVRIIRHGSDGFPSVSESDSPHCIHCRQCLAVCPGGAISLGKVTPGSCRAIGPLPPPELMENLLRQRRSVRAYKRQTVPDDILVKIEDILRYAPTGCNDHRLFFRLFRTAEETAELRRLSDNLLNFLIRTGILRILYPNYKRFLDKIRNGEDVIFRNAPAVIVAATPKDAPCRDADPWIALSYLDLYLQTLGLGSCWCGFALYAFRFYPPLRGLLRLPKGYKIGAVLLFGAPDVVYHRAPEPEPYPVK